jgi:hypothetical protein
MTSTTTKSGARAYRAARPVTVNRTRGLLACGVLAGVLFPAASLIQAVTRSGFDLRRHPFSLLSLGDLGWVQIANFVVSGLLFIACAAGMRRALRSARGGTWGPLTVGAFGVGMIAGGVFVADPALGFPPGAPVGQPEVISWHGNLHALAFLVGPVSLLAACAALARYFAVRKERGLAIYSAATGIVFATLAALSTATLDFGILAIGIVLGWTWTSVVAVRLRRQVSAGGAHSP